MERGSSKTRAVIESASIALLALLVFMALQVPPLGPGQDRWTHYHLLEYAAVMVIALLAVALSRRGWAAFGLSAPSLRYHLGLITIGLIPALILGVALGLLGWNRWQDAVLLALIQAGLIVATAWLLRNKPNGSQSLAAGLFLFLATGLFRASGTNLGQVLARVGYVYLLSVPAEEFLFRGYIQSRLNQAFGRPYRFFGVPWGIGILLSSLLFGLWHLLNPLTFNLLLGQFDLRWLHGLWTFFFGLFLGYFREKGGSVLAPTVLHGFVNYAPQAIIFDLLGAL
ncbi:MAG: CPBP family intramembrane metalloprotease [Anaerolineae bacterium]|jgi:membrane protease YdiL (CAAX protease family)